MTDFNRWKLGDGRELLLYTPAELKALPDGTEVVAVDGTMNVLPVRDWDEERFGYSAYGIETEPEPDSLLQHPYGELADALGVKARIEANAQARQ